MSIRVISVGRTHEEWVAAGIERYEKRLRRPFDVEWVFLSPSGLDEREARQDESERLLSRLDPTDYVVLLDETGKQLTSPALAKLFDDRFTYGSITLIIGGAYGVNQTLQQRAQFVWSLSPLVFPHQLVRLVLMEQLYRSQQIIAGSGYHHS